jgi:hypothetical protein
MPEFVVKVPEKMDKKMRKFSEINWSGFVDKAIEQKIKELDRRDKMLKKLGGERDMIDWSVKLQRASRKGRSEKLKQEGLL